MSDVATVVGTVTSKDYTSQSRTAGEETQLLRFDMDVGSAARGQTSLYSVHDQSPDALRRYQNLTVGDTIVVTGPLEILEAHGPALRNAPVARISQVQGFNIIEVKPDPGVAHEPPALSV